MKYLKNGGLWALLVAVVGEDIMNGDTLFLRYWFREGWTIYSKTFKKITLLMIIVVTLSWGSVLFKYFPYSTWFMFFYVLLIKPPLLAGFAFFSLKLARGENALPKDFMAGFLHFGKIWLTDFIYSLLLLTGIVLFVVPGVIWGIKYGFSMMGVLDKELSPFNALKFSGKITQGHKHKLFVLACLALLLFGFQILFYHSIKVSLENCSYFFVSISLVCYLFLAIAVPSWLSLVMSVAYNKLANQIEKIEK